MESIQVLKHLISLFGFSRARAALTVPDYSQLAPSKLAILYEEAHSTLMRYVDFAWNELQQPRPVFVAFQDRALAIETSHEIFLKHYGNYLGVVRELERCHLQRKPLSSNVVSAIKKVTGDASTEKSGVLLSTKL
jgi:hypothetical protein